MNYSFMPRYFLLFILFYLINGVLFSQPKIDSLSVLLSKSKGVRYITIINNISEEYLNIQPDSSKKYALTVLTLLKHTSFSKELAAAYDNLGKSYYLKNNIDSALFNFTKSLNIRKRINDTLGIGLSFENLGLIYYQKGEYEKAIESHLQALFIFKKFRNPKNISRTLNNIGLAYSAISNYEKSLQYYQEALEIKKTANDTKGQAISLNQIGNIYLYWGKYTKAILCYQDALKLSEKINFQKGIASCYTNLGIINENLLQHDIALDYFHKSLYVEKKINNKSGIANTLTNIGNIYLAKNELQKALGVFNEALSIREKINDLPGIATSLHNLGHTYETKKNNSLSIDYYLKALKINEQINNQSGICLNLSAIGSNYNYLRQYNQSVHYLQKSLNLALKINFVDQIKNNYELLSEVYANQGSYKEAFTNYKLFKSIYDSLFKLENNKQINEILTKYQTEKKQRMIESLNKVKILDELELNKRQNSINRQRYFFTIGIIIVFVLFLSFYLFYRNQEIRKRNQLQSELNKANISALSRQMNPHFIFNAMNSIQYYILQNDILSSNRYLTKFASLMRNTLNNSQNLVIPIKDEIESLNLYLELETLRFKNRFEYEIIIDEKIDTNLYKIPSLIIQPFIENAIWHGLMPKEESGKIMIELRYLEDKISCRIQDNGVGREKAMELKKQKKQQHRSMGINITKSRLELINKLYKKDLKFTYTDLKDEYNNPLGTLVELNIPTIINL